MLKEFGIPLKVHVIGEFLMSLRRLLTRTDKTLNDRIQLSNLQTADILIPIIVFDIDNFIDNKVLTTRMYTTEEPML